MFRNYNQEEEKFENRSLRLYKIKSNSEVQEKRGVVWAAR